MKNILKKKPLQGFETATGDHITPDIQQPFLNLEPLNLVRSDIL